MPEVVGMLREKSPLVEKLQETALSLFTSYATLLKEKRVHAQEDMLRSLTTSHAPSGLSIGPYSPTGILATLHDPNRDSYTDAFGRIIEPPYEVEFRKRAAARVETLKSVKLRIAEANSKTSITSNNSNQDDFYDQPVRGGLGLGFTSSTVATSTQLQNTSNDKSEPRVDASIDEIYYQPSLLFTPTEISDFASKSQSLLHAQSLVLDDVKVELRSISFILNKLRVFRSLLPGRYITASITQALPELLHVYALLEMIQKSVLSSSTSSIGSVGETYSHGLNGHEFVVARLTDVYRFTWFDELIDFCGDSTWLDDASSSATVNSSVTAQSSKRVVEFDTSFVKVKNEELQLKESLLSKSAIRWYKALVTAGGFDPFNKAQTSSLCNILSSLCQQVHRSTSMDGSDASVDTHMWTIVENHAVLASLVVDVVNVFQSSRQLICLPSFQPSVKVDDTICSVLYRQLTSLRTLLSNFKMLKPFIAPHMYLSFLFEWIKKSDLRNTILSFVNCMSSKGDERGLVWAYSFVCDIAQESMLSTEAGVSDTHTVSSAMTKLRTQFGISEAKATSLQKLADEANKNSIVSKYKQENNEILLLSELYSQKTSSESTSSIDPNTLASLKSTLVAILDVLF